MSWVTQVFIYALITALCTWLWALPFCFFKNLTKSTIAKMNAIAASLMIAASFGLMYEALWSREMIDGRSMRHIVESYFGIPFVVRWVALWVLVWLAFIMRSEKKLQKYDNLSIDMLRWANAKKALLIVWVMTLHSFSEGVAIGVSFGPSETFGIFISLALALHNIPEWLAIAAVMVPRGVKRWHAALRWIFSSLPQPLMAIPAYVFVSWFAPFLPVWLWFAAGAMLWMSFSELLPEAIHDAKSETVATFITIGILAMIIFQTLLGG